MDFHDPFSSDVLINSDMMNFDDSEATLQNNELMAQSIANILNPEEPSQIYESLQYIINNLSYLEKSDAVQISIPLCHFALDFEHIIVAAKSWHLLSIFNRTFPENFEEIIAQFTNDAILQADFIGHLCLQELTEENLDLIVTYITFSAKMFSASIQSGLIDQIIKNRPCIADPRQTMLHLRLIFTITQSKKVNKKDDLLKQIYTKSLEPILQFESLRITEIAEFIIKILSALFECKFQDELIMQNLFEDYCQKYITVLSEHSANCLSFFLNILFHSSKHSFIENCISKYSLYKFIIPFLIENEETPLIDPSVMKLSWQILANFINDNPEQILYVFENSIVEISIQICIDGNLQMKKFVIDFMLEIISYIIDCENPLIFEHVRQIRMIPELLQLTDCIDYENSCAIIENIYELYKYLNNADDDRFERLREDLNDGNEVHDSLTQWLDNYNNDDDISLKCCQLLMFIDDEDEELSS